MSASLVGSEMCIRDRHLIETFELMPLHGKSDMPPTLSAATVRGLARECACLLYTSDAADDM
eukprot:11989164-Alexandrium_andersonii.AAC.1